MKKLTPIELEGMIYECMYSSYMDDGINEVRLAELINKWIESNQKD